MITSNTIECSLTLSGRKLHKDLIHFITHFFSCVLTFKSSCARTRPLCKLLQHSNFHQTPIDFFVDRENLTPLLSGTHSTAHDTCDKINRDTNASAFLILSGGFFYSSLSTFHFTLWYLARLNIEMCGWDVIERTINFHVQKITFAPTERHR